MPIPVSRVAGRGQAGERAVEAAPAGADVVAVHGPGQDPVGRRSNRSTSFSPWWSR